jgi:hypothetical protein
MHKKSVVLLNSIISWFQRYYEKNYILIFHGKFQKNYLIFRNCWVAPPLLYKSAKPAIFLFAKEKAPKN